MKLYKINEIFYSLQGEGHWVGLPATFIRFAGCNLSCDFCDTEFDTINSTIPARVIIEAALKNPARTVILTGGEPMLQVDGNLVHLLHLAGFRVHMESNGTIPPVDVNWLTISPKENCVVVSGDELKIVYQGQDLKRYRAMRFMHKFLQPCSMQNVQETIQACKENPEWRLSIQMHKLLNIR